MKLLKDVFYGPGNLHLDLGRVISFCSFVPLFAAAVYNMQRGEALDILALGGGFAAVLTAAAVLIAAKDIANTNALSQVRQDETAAAVALDPPTPSGTQKVEVVNEPSNAVPVTAGDER
jgi:hypothetical protein